MTLTTAVNNYKRAMIEREANIANLEAAQRAVRTAQAAADKNRKAFFKARDELRDVILGLPLGTTGGTFGVD